MGAGDEMPDALRQLGLDVTLLTESDLAQGDLSRFDAIVAGVRAYNVRTDLRANQPRLMKYVENGGTYVVQYQTGEGGGERSRGGPPPVRGTAAAAAADTAVEYRAVSVHGSRRQQWRVTVEEAPVTFPHPDSRLLQIPESHHREGFPGLGAGARRLFRDAVGPAISDGARRAAIPARSRSKAARSGRATARACTSSPPTRGSGSCRRGCRGRTGCSRIC